MVSRYSPPKQWMCQRYQHLSGILLPNFYMATTQPLMTQLNDFLSSYRLPPIPFLACQQEKMTSPDRLDFPSLVSQLKRVKTMPIEIRVKNTEGSVRKLLGQERVGQGTLVCVNLL